MQQLATVHSRPLMLLRQQQLVQSDMPIVTGEIGKRQHEMSVFIEQKIEMQEQQSVQTEAADRLRAASDQQNMKSKRIHEPGSRQESEERAAAYYDSSDRHEQAHIHSRQAAESCAPGEYEQGRNIMHVILSALGQRHLID